MAARFFVNGGGNNNWGTTGNWSLTDGGAGGQSVPSSVDDVHFTANSPNCTVDTTTRSALSLDFTGYASTITMNQSISAPSVTLSPGMSISGASALSVSLAGTLTANGKTWTAALSITASATVTFADDWAVTGLVTLGSSTNNTVINGSTLTAAAGLRCGVSSGSVSGTTLIIVSGTGTLDAPTQTTGRCQAPIHINAPGFTVTISSVFNIDLGKLRYTAGTVIAGNTWTAIGSMIMSRVRTGM